MAGDQVTATQTIDLQFRMLPTQNKTTQANRRVILTKVPQVKLIIKPKGMLLISLIDKPVKNIQAIVGDMSGMRSTYPKARLIKM